MTKEILSKLIATVTVKDVAGGKKYGSGIFVQRMTREQLSEIITLAGQKLGEIPEGTIVNPEYLQLGP
jgi:hypothetical protein